MQEKGKNNNNKRAKARGIQGKDKNKSKRGLSFFTFFPVSTVSGKLTVGAVVKLVTWYSASPLSLPTRQDKT
jgi:hypothetical protein